VPRCFVAIALILCLAGCNGDSFVPAAGPSDPYLRGALAYQQGDAQTAMEQLQRAIEANPGQIMAHVLLAQLFRDKEDYAAAAQRYRSATFLDPYTWTHHYNLGLMCHHLERLHEAKTSYHRALELNPTDFQANMYLGLVYAALNDAATGLPYSAKATQLQPLSAEAWANYGVVLDTAGQSTAAEVAYRKSLEINAQRTETLLNLAANLMNQGKPRQAANTYLQALKKVDNTFVRQRYGLALLQDGQLDQARQEFERALAADPGNYRAMAGLGDVAIAEYERSARLDEDKRRQAIQWWQKSLALRSDQPRLVTLLQRHQQ